MLWIKFTIKGFLFRESKMPKRNWYLIYIARFPFCFVSLSFCMEINNWSNTVNMVYANQRFPNYDDILATFTKSWSAEKNFILLLCTALRNYWQCKFSVNLEISIKLFLVSYWDHIRNFYYEIFCACHVTPKIFIDEIQILLFGVFFL